MALNNQSEFVEKYGLVGVGLEGDEDEGSEVIEWVRAILNHIVDLLSIQASVLEPLF